MPKQLKPAAVKLLRDAAEAEYDVGDRRLAVAMELLLEWYEESLAGKGGKVEPNGNA